MNDDDKNGSNIGKEHTEDKHSIRVPTVVLTEETGPSDPATLRGRRRSAGPSLTINTNMDTNLSSSDREEYHDAQGKSPVSSFFSKVTRSSSRGSRSQSRGSSRIGSPRVKRVSQMVPYMTSNQGPESNAQRQHRKRAQNNNSTYLTPGNEDSLDTRRNSLLLDEPTSPDVINRGLSLALGNHAEHKEGMWLPVGEGKSGANTARRDQDPYSEADDEYHDAGLNASDNSDQPEEEGIKLDDLKLNVPSYGEMLKITTSAASNQEDELAVENELHVAFDHDPEQFGSLRVPSMHSKRPPLSPTSPGKQISSAFMKFSARVNGRDEDDRSDMSSRSPTISAAASYDFVSDEEEEEEEEREDYELSRESMFDHVAEDEGSSGSNNDIRDEDDSQGKAKPFDTRTRYAEMEESGDFMLDDNGLSEFEPILAQGRDEKITDTSIQLKLYGKSLRIFGPTNRLRLKCCSIIYRKWFEPLITALLFAQTVILSYEQWDYSHSGYVLHQRYSAIDWTLFVINCLHTVETIFKIITFGLYDDSQMLHELNIPVRNSVWKDYVKYNIERFKKKKTRSSQKRNLNKLDSSDTQHNANLDSRFSKLDAAGKIIEKRPAPIHSVTQYEFEERPLAPNVPFTRAYLRNLWNRIDFISCVCFWLSFLLSIERYDLKHHIMIFRSLMCLRILRLANFTHGTSVILKAVKKATPELLDVGLFLFCFWVFFAIIGVQSFKSSLRRKCVWFNPDDTSDYYINEFQFCGSYLDPETYAAKPYIYNNGVSSNSIKGFRCPVNSKCVSNQNPYDNSISFDNIANSFELVFVVMSANTFTDLMYYTMDSDTMAAALFYIFGVFFLTVWIVNLLIAVIVNAFKITRDEILSQMKNKTERRLFFNNSRARARLVDFKRKNVKLKWYRRFEFIFLILIIISLTTQCTRSSNSTAKHLDMIYAIESSLTLILLAEIILRLLCYFPQWRLFFYSKQNCFDLFLAIITSVIALPPIYHNANRVYMWFTVFQIARWYRIVLAVTYTRRTWYSVLGHVKTIFDLSLFYFIFLFLISVIMARLFEGIIAKDELDDNPFSMYNLPNSIISLYAITSTENWTDTLYSLQEYAKDKGQQFFGAAYLIIWFMFSNMIVLNIFIAVISENLSIPDIQKRREQIIQYLQKLRREIKSESEKGILADFKDRLLQPKPDSQNSKEEILYLLLSGKVKGFSDQEIVKTLESEVTERQRKGFMRTQLEKISVIKRAIDKSLSVYGEFKENPFFKSDDSYQTFKEASDLGNTFRGMIDDDDQLNVKKREYLKEHPQFNIAFYMLPPDHRLRRLCQKIVGSSRGDRIDGVEPNATVSFLFSIIMFAVTVAMVVVACYATPLYRKSHGYTNETWDWLSEVDFACTLVFSAEFMIKVIADGLVYTPNGYLTSSWNIIDFIVLITLWVNLITILRGIGVISSVVNGVKALRALRLLTLSSKAKSTFQKTIIAGFWQILSAAAISMTLLFPFSIWGLNLFNGRLGYCLDGVSTAAECYEEFTSTVFKWDIVSPNAYVNPPLEFNSFQKSILSLFEIISLEGWVDMLQNVMNSTGVGTVPSLFASPENGIFVVMFNFISTVFILTLFVSVIIQNYSRNTGSAYRTTEQASWYEVEKILQQVKASKRGEVENFSTVQFICHRLITQKNKYWRLFINMCLILHTIALLIEVYPSIDGLDDFRYYLYLAMSAVFMVHMVLTLVAGGPKIVLSSKWNWLSFFIVLGAFITTVISFFVSRQTVYANINKLFLVGILLLIIPRIDRLEQLLRYAVASLPSVVSLLYTWGVLFLVYAIAMNQIFGLTRTGPNTSNNINTRTVTKTLILLFRMSFGEGWNYIMDDFTLSSPYCQTSSNSYDSDCGSKVYAYILFISWNIVSMFIFVNMFVSLIVDSFSYIYNTSEPHAYISRNERRKFKEAWLKYDPKGTGYIPPSDLHKFLGSLNGVLSYKIYNNGRFAIPELKKKWFQQVENDPYSVFIDYPAMNSTLSQIDPKKVQIRRLKYERLVEEILTEMQLKNHPGVSFTSVILKVALYAHFEENKCLTLDDFMKRYVAMEKVDAILKQKKVYHTLKTVVARWRYRKRNFKDLVSSSGSNNEVIRKFGGGITDAATAQAPLIFISEYLKNDDDQALRGRAATLASIGQAKRFGSFTSFKTMLDENSNDSTNPFINPFEEQIDEVSENEDSGYLRGPGLELHHRPMKGSNANDQKSSRVLIGSSSALSEAPIIVVQPPKIPFSRSRNSSSESVASDNGRNIYSDSELGSLLSVDLAASPRR